MDVRIRVKSRNEDIVPGNNYHTGKQNRKMRYKCQSLCQTTVMDLLDDGNLQFWVVVLLFNYHYQIQLSDFIQSYFYSITLIVPHFFLLHGRPWNGKAKKEGLFSLHYPSWDIFCILLYLCRNVNQRYKLFTFVHISFTL